MAALRYTYTSSHLSLWNIFFLWEYEPYSLSTYTHIYVYIFFCLVFSHCMSEIYPKSCKEYLFLGLLIWTSCLFSLFVPWISFEFRWIVSVSRFSSSRLFLGSASALYLVYLILSPSGNSYLLFIIVTIPYTSSAICLHEESFPLGSIAMTSR